jgi:hypothetical protein
MDKGRICEMNLVPFAPEYRTNPVSAPEKAPLASKTSCNSMS